MLSRAQALEDLDVLILLDWQRAANASPRQPLIVEANDARGLGLGIGSFA
jgi:hypothetical protein